MTVVVDPQVGWALMVKYFTRNLKPSTEYQLKASITNALGGNPESWSSLLFNTSHTVPDAPRHLAVYRLNATTMWVRWKVPERPSGEIRGYVVSVQGAGSLHREVELVSPSSVCPAWPDLVCHRVDGLQPHKEYTIAVSAVNEYGDKPGEAATVKRTTELGVPDPPKNLLVVDTLARSLVIQWQLPDSINADLSHFDVLVTPTAGRPRREEVAAIEEQPVYKHSIINLTPKYDLQDRCALWMEWARGSPLANHHRSCMIPDFWERLGRLKIELLPKLGPDLFHDGNYLTLKAIKVKINK